MVTLTATTLGVFAGAVFAVGWGWLAGCIAACAQVLDGVDGQFSRITGLQSKGGAFLDSVLDRYSDVALVLGMILYLIRTTSGNSHLAAADYRIFLPVRKFPDKLLVGPCRKSRHSHGKPHAGKQGHPHQHNRGMRMDQLFLPACALARPDLPGRTP